MPVTDVIELADTIVERSALSFESDDSEEGRAALAAILREHTLQPVDRKAVFSLRAHAVMLGGTTFTRLKFTSSFTALSAPMDTDYMIPFRVRGSSLLRYAGREVITGRDTTALVGASERVGVSVGDNYDHILLKVPAARVESLAAQIAGAPAPGRLRIPMVQHAVPPALLRFLTGALQLPTAGGTGEMGERIEAVLVESLLLAGAGPLGLEAPAERVRARAVLRQAQEYMMADLSRPPALTSVAAHCGVSVRTIQIVFRTVLNTTASAWLRRERLRRVHAMLLIRNPAFVTVTDVAIAHGFVHMGDFAAQFKAEYGVSPSQVQPRDPSPAGLPAVGHFL